MKRFAAILIVMAMLLPLLVSCGGNEKQVATADRSPFVIPLG